MNSRRLFDLTTMAWHAERWGREVVVVTVALDQKLSFSSHSRASAKDTRSRMLPSKTYGPQKKKCLHHFVPRSLKIMPSCKKCSLHFIGRVTNFTGRTFYLKNHTPWQHQVHQSFLMSLARRWAASNRCGLGRSTLHRKCPSVGSYSSAVFFFLKGLTPRFATCYAIMEYLILFLTILSSVFWRCFDHKGILLTTREQHNLCCPKLASNRQGTVSLCWCWLLGVALVATLHASSIYLASAEDLKDEFAFERSGEQLVERWVCLQTKNIWSNRVVLK